MDKSYKQKLKEAYSDPEIQHESDELEQRMANSSHIEFKRFTNFYECPRCKTTWQDEWDSTCDDRCPNCNLTCSPFKSEDINDQN